LIVACSDDPDNAPADVQITPILSATEQSGSTQTPGAVLTPKAGLNVDLSTARRLEAEGDVEDAAAAYVAVAANSPADRTEATLSGARLLMVLERYDDARLLLEPFLARSGVTGDELAGHYILARAYSGLEMWQQSLDEFDKYIATGRPAVPYAYLDRSYILLELERPIEAAQSVQKGLDAGVPDSLQRTYVLAKAQSYERAGQFGQAIDAYKELMDVSGIANDDALALSRIIALKKLITDPTYKADFVTLMSNYPGTPQAMDGLADPDAATLPADVRGLIYYRHNDYTKAEPEFQKQADASPGTAASALSYYYLAAIAESRGNLDEAVAGYTQSNVADPSSPLADDALWWKGRIEEQDGKLDDAGALYARIVNEYPNSQFAADAAFRRGLLPYRDQRYADAASTWAADLAAVTDPAERQRIQLWQAKSLLEAKQDAAAAPILDGLANANEDDYVGIRAFGLKAGQHEQPDAERESGIDLTPDWDWAAAETWLATKTGKPADVRIWETDSRWAKAQELWRVGREDWGDLEVYDMIDAYATDSVAMYTLSRSLLDSGRVSMSGRAGQRLLRTLDTNPDQGLPKALLSLSYPAAFGPMVQQYADDVKVSPLLLLAFIRQESFFDPRAVSAVGALGLTQLLPETATSLANAMGIDEPSDEDLLHADLNLKLGARYMADQLQRFGNEVFVALAAYNAGPTAADRWREDSGDDADLFVETIEFGESRLYVEIVSENYAIYRYLYGGEAEPNLPN
jgi:soluble lytic murein transglycosylase